MNKINPAPRDVPDEVHAAVAVLVAHGVDGATFEALIRRTEQSTAEARAHDDEPTPLPFLGFTADGHPVGGPVPADVQRPALVARCGGPMVCGACMDDAGDLRRAALEADRG